MSFLNTTDTGLIWTGVASLAIGLPAFFTPQRLHEVWVPTIRMSFSQKGVNKPSVYTPGVASLIQILGATLIAAASGSFFIQQTEDIDSKRAYLQGASIFGWLGAYLAWTNQSVWDPLAWKVTLGGSLFTGVTSVFYGCLCSTDRA